MNTPTSLLKKLGVKRVGKELMGVSEYRLSNGLKVLLKPTHLSEVVALMIVYKVGSRNEAVGYTGSTHILEHMMFKGSRRFNASAGKDIMSLLSEIGAEVNATTSFDRTAYHALAGKEHLKLLIALEADRMRNLSLRRKDLDSEMTVVANELAQGENNPSLALAKELFAQAYREHPYHHPVIGWRSDVESVSIQRLRQFYREFYQPNNATVILSGRFETGEALKLLVSHFGKFSSSSKPIPAVHTKEPAQEGQRRFEVHRSGGVPELVVGYHVPPSAHADTYTLSVINLLLGSGSNPSGRLYKRLVASGLATAASAAHFELRDPGLFTIWVNPAQESSLPAVEKAIYEELSALARQPIAQEELRRIKSGLRKHRIIETADPLDFAELLAEGEADVDWRWILEYNDRVDEVSAQDICRVAASYFQLKNSTVGYYIPEKASNAASETAQLQQTEPKEPSEKRGRKSPVRLNRAGSSPEKQPASVTDADPPLFSKVVRQILPNGLTVLAMHAPGTGIAAVDGAVFAGDYHAPEGRKALASLVATMLSRGSSNHSKEEMEKVFDEMGTALGFSRDHFRSGFDTTATIEDLPRLLEMLSEILASPLFLEEELDEVKRLMLSSLVEAASDAEEEASVALMRSLYPEGHPFFARSTEEKLADLMSITTQDLRTFHKQHYSPQSTILAVVGDIEPSCAIKLIEQHFGNWTGPERKGISMPTPPKLPEAKRIEIDLPDKSTVDIVIGKTTSLSRNSSDYFAASIANAALGKDTIVNRLGKELRVKHGLTYGVYSSFGLLSFGAAPWTIELSVAPEKVDKALALVNEVLSDYVRDGIGEQELSAEVNRAIGAFAVNMRTPAALSDVLVDSEFIGMDPGELDKVADNFRALSKEDVDAAIARHIAGEAVTVVSGTLSQ